MSKARQLADLGNQVDDGAITGSNMVVNGGMTVAQRSTSEAGLGNGTNSYKTVDRYTTYISGLGTWTQSQDTNAPEGFGHSLKVLCTAADASPAASDRMLIQTKLEGQDIQSLGFGNTSNTYTVSFYVKSNVTGTYILEQYGDSASATGNNISTAYTINSANTWERKVISLNVDSGAMTANNTSGLALSFWLGSGTNYTSGTLNTSWSSPASADRAVGQVNLASATNNYWQITGVCLNVGDSAIDFPHESYGDTLARCQRYYERLGNVDPTAFAVGYNESTSEARGVIHYKKKRSSPSVSSDAASNFSNVSTGSSVAATSLSFTTIAPDSCRYICVSGNTTLIDGGASLLQTFSSAGSIYIDAEL